MVSGCAGVRMPNTTMTATTDTCHACQVKLTHVLTLHVLDNHNEPPTIAPFSCPECGHAGTVAAQTGRRIVRVDTKPYLQPLGR